MVRRLALSLFLLLIATGCGDDGGSDPAEAIQQFETSPEAGFEPRARLNLAVVADPEGSREAALEQLGSDDPDVRIAAVYALSITLKPQDADAMASVLEAPDPGERVLAASALLSLEDKRAIPVLIQSLSEDATIPFGSPRAGVWEKARFALLQSTGQDFGLREASTPAEAAATAPEWQAWWADAEDSFEVVPAPDPFGQ